MTAAIGARRSRSLGQVRALTALTGTVGLRTGLVLAQAAMVVQTWQLWEVRTIPPNLPLWSWLPRVDFGPLVLATLVLVLVRPRVGLPVHIGVLVVAMAGDQLRLQPEFVSVAILLVATGPWRLAPTLGRAHLASLWLWAGLAKATSTGFGGSVARTVADNLHVPGWHAVVAWAVPATEIALGLAAIVPITRRSAGLAAFAFHTATVVVLHMHLSWAIMPWNLALAWAALHLLFLSPAPERPSGGWRTWRPFDRDRLRTALLVVVFAYPLLVYVGLLDLYLGHHVYSSDGGSAQVCEADGRCSTFSIDVSGAAVGAAFPRERRLYEQWFRLLCRPGQTLVVQGRQFRPPLDHTVGTGDSRLRC